MQQQQKLQSLINRFQSLVDRLQQDINQTNTSSSASKDTKPKGPKVSKAHQSRIKHWWNMVVSKLKKWAHAAYNIGKQTVSYLVKHVQTAFYYIEDVLKITGLTSNPGIAVLQKYVMPLIQKVIQLFRDHNKKKETKDIDYHIRMVINGLESLAWILYPDPKDYVRNCLESLNFNGHKLLKLNDQKSKEFYKAWREVITGLLDYVKDHHEEGLEWNDRDGTKNAGEMLQKLLGVSQKQHEQGKEEILLESGESDDANVNAVPTIPSSAGGVPPPPPPPPPPPAAANFSGESNASKMFEEIRQLGQKGVRELLKKGPKVDKNAPVVQPKKREPKQESKKPAAEVKRAPEFKVVDNQIFISNYQNEKFNFQQGEYNYTKAFIIDNCNKCSFTFNVKVKAISAIKCRGSKFLIKQGLVSSFEVMHSKKMEIESKIFIPTIQVDACSDCEIFLHEPSKATEVLTSLSTQVNIQFEEEETEQQKNERLAMKKGDEDDDDDDKKWVTYPIPQQFSTKIKGNAAKTTQVEHFG